MKPFTVDLEDLSERQKEREQADTREIFERIYQGSMPAIVSGINSNSQLFYSSYLSTYIERDVRELSDAIDSLKFLRFITAVAAGVPKATILTYFYPEVSVERMSSYRKKY